MYLHKDVSDHIEKTFPTGSERAIPLASLVAGCQEAQELGLFNKKDKRVGRLDIVHLKVRAIEDDDGVRALSLHFGALHVATLEKVYVAGELRYEVQRGRYAELRFNIRRARATSRLKLIAA